MKKLTKKDFEEALNKPFDVDFVANKIIKDFEYTLRAEFSRVENSKDKAYRLKLGMPLVSMATFIYDNDIFKTVKKEFEPRGFNVDLNGASGIIIQLYI